jgi:hypothetical protein
LRGIAAPTDPLDITVVMIFIALLQVFRFAQDSPLEEEGFELLVPPYV